MLKKLSVLLGLLILVACGATNMPTAQPTTTPWESIAPLTATATPAKPLRDVTIAMSYIPNIQFAPYYVAAAKGYYAEAGLNVKFDYNFENDVVQRAASYPQSKIEFATAGGISVLLARQQQLPIKTVMTLYQQFPIVFFSKGTVPLTSVADLKGKTIGIPGRFGETYYGLLAALQAANLQESDVTIVEIGFTQAQAVLEDKVQIAVGFATNEPIILKQQGQTINVLRVSDILPLASDGTVVSEELIKQEPAVVKGFVQATVRGMADTIANPDEAYDISIKQIPEAQLGDPKLQRQVLQEAINFYASDVTKANGLGFTDTNEWQATAKFMLTSKLLTAEPQLDAAFTNEFIQK